MWITDGVAPISPSNRGANSAPKIPAATEIAMPQPIAWTDAMAAPSGSFSPMRRATVAVPATLRPIAMLKMRTISDSVSPITAMASEPSRATQNASTRPKVDSMAISSTVGIASSAMPRLRRPSVKSCCVPDNASRRNSHLLVETVSVAACMIAFLYHGQSCPCWCVLVYVPEESETRIHSAERWFGASADRLTMPVVPVCYRTDASMSGRLWNIATYFENILARSGAYWGLLCARIDKVKSGVGGEFRQVPPPAGNRLLNRQIRGFRTDAAGGEHYWLIAGCQPRRHRDVDLVLRRVPRQPAIRYQRILPAHRHRTLALGARQRIECRNSAARRLIVDRPQSAAVQLHGIPGVRRIRRRDRGRIGPVGGRIDGRGDSAVLEQLRRVRHQRNGQHVAVNNAVHGYLHQGRRRALQLPGDHHVELRSGLADKREESRGAVVVGWVAIVGSRDVEAHGNAVQIHRVGKERGRIAAQKCVVAHGIRISQVRSVDGDVRAGGDTRSEEHTSELQSPCN